VRPPVAGVAQTEREFVSFFEHSPDLLCVAGLDCRFRRLSATWTSVLGWTAQELLDCSFLDFVHPEDTRATRAEVARLAAGAPTVMFENRYRHRDGSYRWLQWNARPAAGLPLVYAVARDVTRQNWLEREIIEIADREKESLGRELHDGLCQTLAGISALSTTLARTLAARSQSAASEAAAEIAALLNEAIDEARHMAHGTGLVGLAQLGLTAALESLALAVEHQFRVSCTLLSDHACEGLQPEVQRHLFRLVQEAIHNGITHGRAGRIEIILRRQAGRALLCVRDDGIGISADPGTPYGGGLHTMDCRARLVGGTLAVRRRGPRGGTVVTCTFALPAAPGQLANPHHAAAVG
jgi:PAS domain S-box-containing protein